MQVCFREVEVFPSLIENVCLIGFMQVCFGEVEVFPSLIENVCFVGFMRVCFGEVEVFPSLIENVCFVSLMQRSRLLEIIGINVYRFDGNHPRLNRSSWNVLGS
jgi:hypothetical protein